MGATESTVREACARLQRDCPDDLRVIAWSPSHAHLLRRLHAALAAHRVRGDWYEPAVALAIEAAGDFGAWVEVTLGERASVAVCGCGAPVRPLRLTCGAAGCVRRAKGVRTGARSLVLDVGDTNVAAVRATR